MTHLYQLVEELEPVLLELSRRHVPTRRAKFALFEWHYKYMEYRHGNIYHTRVKIIEEGFVKWDRVKNFLASWMGVLGKGHLTHVLNIER